MKKIITFLALLMMGVTLAKAGRETPYAIWCEDNYTLYFGYTDETISYGRPCSFTESNNVTKLWRGDDVTLRGGYSWPSTLKDKLERVVFDESFKQVKPENLYKWFASCGILKSIEGLQNLDTSEVIYMSSMFNGCGNLTSLDVSHFNTEKVMDMFGMFFGCSKLTSLDVSHFNTEKVTDMSMMFMGCSKLKTIYCNDTWNISSSEDMFKGCTSLVGEYGKTYSESDIDCRFANPGENGYFTIPRTAYALWCEGNNTLYFVNTNKEVTTGNQYDFTENNEVTAIWSGNDVTNTGSNTPKWYTTVHNDLKKVVFDESFKRVKPTSTNSWFNDCTELTSTEGLQYLDTSEVTDMNCMFRCCSGLTSLDLSTFNTEKVTNMSYMFDSCSGLTSLDVSKFNTEKVEDMNYMFSDCSSLSSLDVSKFNTENVTNMYGMFSSCSKLQELDVSKFNTEKVEYMSLMFSGCSSLSSLDVSKFNTEKVKEMFQMFEYCEFLTTLDISSFKTTSLQNSVRMFTDCSNLKTIYCNDTWNVRSSSIMFEGCTSLVGEYGKTYSESDTDCEFANPGENGYFTLTRETLRGTEYDGAYWATYYNGLVGCVADENTTVYVGQLSPDNSKLELREVSDNIINAGEAVILKSTAAEITLTRTSKYSSDNLSGNSLWGMDKASPVPTNLGTIYTLSIEHGDMAFRQFVGNELGARKAYLAISDASGAPIRIIFGDEATGIADLSTNEIDTKGYYSIDGRYHNGMPTTRGVYIVNGRKVLIK